MKKLLFISSFNISDNRLEKDGVTKKIKMEIDTFRKFGYSVDFLVQEEGISYLETNTGEREKITRIEGRYYKDFEKIYTKLIEISNNVDYDIVYMRYEGASRKMHLFLKKIKKTNPNLIILAEKPTFAKKSGQGLSFKSRVLFSLKQLSFKIYSKCIDRIVTFDNQDFMYGRPTIKIENFADVKNLPIRAKGYNDPEVHLIAIAQLSPAHGFDRVIKGLADYYKNLDSPKRQVYLHIIGDGQIRKTWEALVHSHGLEKFVIFEGTKTTKEISFFVDRSYLAIACLAIFRKQCEKASELKIREYCARGIPFIYSSFEPILDGQNWCLKVPHDESPIDIYQLLHFIDSLNYNEVSEEMRKFAEKYCTPESQLIKVIPPITCEKREI